MATKITAEQLKEFNDTFDRCVDHLNQWMDDYKKTFQETIYEFDLTSELNFNSLAKQAFLYRLGNFYTKHNIMEQMIRDAHRLIESPNEDLDKEA